MGKRKVMPKTMAVEVVDEQPAEVPMVSGTVVPAVNAENLIAQAIRQKLPVETLERLLAMRKELKAEFAKEAFFLDLAAFQSECPAIPKTAEVKDRDGKVRWRYAPMEDVVMIAGPLLKKHGFSYTTKMDQTDTSVTASTEAHHKDGHCEVTTLRMPIDPAPAMNKSQAVVSAFSYGRRVTFEGAFGIMTAEQDDDGEGSGQPVDEKESESEKKPPRASEQKPEPKQETRQPETQGESPKQPPAQPKGTAKGSVGKLPNDPAFAKMKPAGIAAYCLLRDAYKSKLLEKAYCEKQGERLRNNATNEAFLKSLKEEIEKDILAANAAAKEKTA